MTTQNQNIPVPHASRLDPSRQDYKQILEEHRQACLAGKDFYFDPATGYSVFTAFFHLRRGSCCNSGCRHCPWVKN